jgi:hypothetical protein
MMVMVSLNLADIMTATRPRISKPLHDNSDDPINPGQVNSEDLIKREGAERERLVRHDYSESDNECENAR